mmetsp:Transcript_38063/g.95681  ORF Transcript_38063/g.95681 Transcript_38063/m.95681 type:complete len:316 (-) Transcript_38063:131-1078(-)|eukprot:jgi/Tetstr1/454498/TSEL_041398.t1
MATLISASPAARLAPAQLPRRQRRLRAVSVTAAATGRRRAGAQAPNLYETLHVPHDASGDELKASYRRLQKEYHPDQSGDQFVGLSAEINQAFEVLRDPQQRAAHDRALREANRGRMPGQGALRRKSGIVGPIRHGAVVLREEFTISAEEAAATEVAQFGQLVVWIREWCRTMAFAAGLPLPFPVQADDVPGGARLSFITVADGSIDTLGALKIVAEARQGKDGAAGWEVQVQRITYGGRPGSLPLEERVLRSLSNALRERAKRVKGHKGLNISGLAAVMAQGFIGAVSILGAVDQEVGDLEAYHLKHDILKDIF